ncbi:MAG TPA: HEAT repeat domain-containing protein, partial [Actinomycetota bacterium]
MEGMDGSSASRLKGIESVPWGDLRHAYGRATDVPTLLEMLAEGSDEQRDHAVHELFGNILHQGAVYEATAPAVPFLAALARAENIPIHHRGKILYLLSAIASGSSYLDVHRDMLFRNWTEKDEQDLAKELRWVEAARRAVAEE